MSKWTEDIIETLKTYSSPYVTAERRPLSLTDIRKRIILTRNPKKNLRDITDGDKPTYKMIKSAMYALIDKEMEMDEEDRTIRYTTSEKGYKGDYYYNGGISTAELRFLIDSVLSSNLFSNAQAKDLSYRIQKMAGIHQSSMTSYIGSFGDAGRDKGLATMVNLELIQSAIDQRRRISFVLNTFAVEGNKVKLKPVENRGRIKKKVNPHYIKMINGKYYLIGTYGDKVDRQTKTYSHRIDLMSDIEVVEAEIAPSGRNLSANESALSRSEYQLMHPHMFSGPMSHFQLKVKPDEFTQIVDWFGNNLMIISQQSDQNPYITVVVTAAKDAMRYWLLQYGESVEAINLDEKFAAEMKEAAERIYQKYGR